ncbi:MAG: hypothetical protein V3R80_03655 [Candidatus Tectomicrobia bacterium]
MLEHGSLDSGQFFRKRLCLFQVGCVEPLGEPTIDRGKQPTRLGALALIPPKAGYARSCP